MAAANFLNKVKDKASGLFSRFFYDDTYPVQSEQESAQQAPFSGNQNQSQNQNANYPAQENAFPFAPAYEQQGGYQNVQPQQMNMQNPNVQNQNMYANNAPYQNYAPQENMYQPQQQPQQQPQLQPVYQKPAKPQPPMFSQFASQMPLQRNRRADQHHQEQMAENVLPFPTPNDQNVQRQPETQWSTRIINVRGINDCRVAIHLLRKGDALIVVMDSISDPAEMRRYVDTLSGACFSLSATITKVSRYGAYFIAPACVLVYADQVTGQMNGAVRPNVSAPRYAPDYQRYQKQPVPSYEEQGFERRVADRENDEGMFYRQPTYTEPQNPSFEKQPFSYGYAEDHIEQIAE